MTDQTGECPIWGGSVKVASGSGDYSFVYSDRAGGKYKVSRSVVNQLKSLSPKDCTAITNWLVQKHEFGEQSPELNSHTVIDALATRLFSPPEQLDRSLLWIVQNLEGLGRTIALGFNPQNVSNYADILASTNRFSAFIGCSDHIEAMEILNFGVKSGLLEVQNYDIGNFGRFSITLDGYKKYEELTRHTVSSKRAFVAMWFSTEMNHIFETAIEPAIKAAGYEPILISRVEHNDQIVDRIISDIRSSKFVVADFTCGKVETTKLDENGKNITEAIHRGGVYFEAGFAKGLGREVIWTVREDCLSKIHFDNAQYNFIVWKSAEDLLERLKLRIIATLDYGPLYNVN
jgi:hypothetical protein